MQDLGKLFVRLMVGGLMLFHGGHKVKVAIDAGFENSIKGFQALLASKDVLPPVVVEWLPYGVYLGEVLAPALIVLGLLTRPAAFILAANMAIAVWLVHVRDFTQINEATGAWALETQAFFFLGALAVLFLGAGKISIGEFGKSDDDVYRRR